MIMELPRDASEQELVTYLTKFNEKHTQTFTFDAMDRGLKESLVHLASEKLSEKCSYNTYTACLETLRILSRDKSARDLVSNERMLSLLLKHSGIEQYMLEASEGPNVTIQDGDFTVMVEAQKCLCNIIYQCSTAQRYCSKAGFLEGIVQRMKTYKDPILPYEVKYFDMKILFLLTALCADIRPLLRFELHGFTYLIEVLDLSLRGEDGDKTRLTDNDVDLACEILKVLFNITVSVDKNSLDEEEEAHFMRLVSILHDLVLTDTPSRSKTEEIQSNVVNLLTNMPRDCYEELLTPMTDEASCQAIREIEYDGKNMAAIVALLEFLYHRLDTPQRSKKEALTPILHSLCEMCRGNRIIRRFCRLRILPPLRGEVTKLPEEGEALRNKLCRLLTNPLHQVKELSADLLFVVCKENVGRMVKYTGYGNAAGLLASRGLMGGKETKTGEYSSDSEGSDTEEYERLRDGINPVTGRWEEERPSPMEGMTEEQKEYEAMELVNMMDKLCRGGVIQPCRMGGDGKPEPVEHIMELTDAVNPSDAVAQRHSDDDLNSD